MIIKLLLAIYVTIEESCETASFVSNFYRSQESMRRGSSKVYKNNICLLARVTAACLIGVVLTGSLEAQAHENKCQSGISDSQIHNECSDDSSRNIFMVKKSNELLQLYAGLNKKHQRFFKRIAIHVAKSRRTALKGLIQSNPKDAFFLSLTPGNRVGLPRFVLKHLESREHKLADLIYAITETLPVAPKVALPDGQNMLTDAEPKETSPPHFTASWSLRDDQGIRQAFSYGANRRHQTKFDTSIHGIALDDVMAITDSPLYLLDAFEARQLGFKPDQVVALHGHRPIELADITEYDLLRQELIDQILRFGPIYRPNNPNAWATGLKRIAAIKITYRGDDRESPYSDSDINIWLGAANDVFRANSQDRTSFFPTIFTAPFEVLPAGAYTSASSTDIAIAIMSDQAIQSFRSAGYNPDDYDRIIIFAPQLFDNPEARGELGGKVITIVGDRENLMATLAHELGHTYGFAHSTLYSTLFGTDPLGPGTSLEFGDIWDMMGIASTGDSVADTHRRHFNAFFKNLAGWLPAASVVDGTLGGDFFLYGHDNSAATGLRAIFVEAGDGSVYWIGKRNQFPENISMTKGVEIRRVSDYTPASYGPVELLDLDHGWSRGAPVGQTTYHSLAEGNTFTDASNGITIRAVFAGSDAAGEFVRVFITR